MVEETKDISIITVEPVLLKDYVSFGYRLQSSVRVRNQQKYLKYR